MLAWWWRVPLSAMIVLEIFGALDVIPVQPVFTDLGLMLTASVVWLFLELNRRQLQLWAVIPAVLAVLLDMLGDYAQWYATVQYYDAGLHAVGSAAAAACVWTVMQSRSERQAPERLQRLLLFTGVVTLGVFYEIEEYLEDWFTHSHRLGDGYDTANDLLLDAVGALVVVLLIKFKRRR